MPSGENKEKFKRELTIRSVINGMKINRKNSSLSEIVDETELTDFTSKTLINNTNLIF